MMATDLFQETQNCQCPTRQLPTLLPTTLPFAATDNNRLKLRDISTEPLQVQHFKHMRTPNSTTNEMTPYASDGGT